VRPRIEGNPAAHHHWLNDEIMFQVPTPPSRNQRATEDPSAIQIPEGSVGVGRDSGAWRVIAVKELPKLDLNE